MGNNIHRNAKRSARNAGRLHADGGEDTRSQYAFYEKYYDLGYEERTGEIQGAWETAVEEDDLDLMLLNARADKDFDKLCRVVEKLIEDRKY